MVFSHFAVMLSQLTIFQLSVKYQSDTSFLLKPFKFCYFLLNLFNSTVVWFCSLVFIFSLFFSNKFLNPSLCPKMFWKMSIVAKFFSICSNSFISCCTLMEACKNRSSLNNCSIKYLLRVFKTESLENICEKVYF